jgi:hypothetical protein
MVKGGQKNGWFFIYKCGHLILLVHQMNEVNNVEKFYSQER